MEVGDAGRAQNWRVGHAAVADAAGVGFASLPGPSAWAAPFKKGCRTHNQTNRQSSAHVLAWQDGFPPGNAKYFI